MSQELTDEQIQVASALIAEGVRIERQRILDELVKLNASDNVTIRDIVNMVGNN